MNVFDDDDDIYCRWWHLNYGWLRMSSKRHWSSSIRQMPIIRTRRQRRNWSINISNIYWVQMSNATLPRISKHWYVMAYAHFPIIISFSFKHSLKPSHNRHSYDIQFLLISWFRFSFQGEGTSALTYLHQTLLGQRMMMDGSFCSVCGEAQAKKRCSSCKKVSRYMCVLIWANLL